jgi:hypothetical protein
MRLNTLFAVLAATTLIACKAAPQPFGPTAIDFGNNIVAPGGERIIPFYMTLHIDQDFFNSAPGAQRWANFALRFKYDARKVDIVIATLWGDVRVSTLPDATVGILGVVLEPGVNGLAAFQKKTEGGRVVMEVGVGNAANNNTRLSGHFFGTEDPDTGAFIPLRWVVKTDNFAHGETYLVETAIAGAGQMAKISPTRTSRLQLQGGFTVPELASWIALLVGLGGLFGRSGLKVKRSG